MKVGNEQHVMEVHGIIQALRRTLASCKLLINIAPRTPVYTGYDLQEVIAQMTTDGPGSIALMLYILQESNILMTHHVFVCLISNMHMCILLAIELDYQLSSKLSDQNTSKENYQLLKHQMRLSVMLQSTTWNGYMMISESAVLSG